MRSISATRLLLALICVPALCTLAGCLERFEAITIRPDGSASLRSEFRGTPEDFTKTADALPEQGGAWTITERQEKDKDGKPRTIRVAELSLANGSPFPDSYAGPNDPRAASALRFPTSLKVTRTGVAISFEFSRTYAHRDEARYNYLKKKLTETDAFKAIEGKDPSELSTEQRTLLIRTLARLEADKHIRFIEAGARPMEADGLWPQQIGLKLRQAAIDYAEHFDLAGADALLKQQQTPEREAAIKAVVGAFTEGLHQAIRETLAKLAVPDDQQKRFMGAAVAERALRQATEDLADERWEVRLAMPGTLIAHNADRIESGVLVWEFSADALMDRDHTLRATSTISPEK